MENFSDLMENEEAFRFFLELYADLPRQGPGDDRITRHTFGLLTSLPPRPVTIDMGCGSGAQTLELARAGCQITAVDLHQIFLDHLIQRMKKINPEPLITPVCTGMESYSPPTPVDLIWSEGAVYNIGFENGLSLWKNHLKNGGFLVVSEMTWLIQNPPAPVKEFWDREYPSMQTVLDNQKCIEKVGYRWIGSFLLPESAWDAFYAPQKENIARIRMDGSLSPVKEEVLAIIEDEIRIFEEYRGTYGYVFYLMQRVA